MSEYKVQQRFMGNIGQTLNFWRTTIFELMRAGFLVKSVVIVFFLSMSAHEHATAANSGLMLS